MDTHFFWLLLGFAGQTLFSARFLLQWLASEKARASVIPGLFWTFSIAGGSALFIYAIHQHDPVFMLGQGTGLLIYGRNIFLNRNNPKLAAA